LVGWLIGMLVRGLARLSGVGMIWMSRWRDIL
jgi:hypothetical protein